LPPLGRPAAPSSAVIPRQKRTISSPFARGLKFLGGALKSGVL
jgi:hypothetical protein